MKKRILFYMLLVLAMSMEAAERQKICFNADWRLQVGDFAEAAKTEFDDSQWQRVTLPYAFNGNEAFRKDIVNLMDTVCWYRKTFTLTEADTKGKVLTDHVWVREDSYLRKSSLTAGKLYAFEARIGTYDRGRTSRDFRLTKIRKITVA